MKFRVNHWAFYSVGRGRVQLLVQLEYSVIPSQGMGKEKEKKGKADERFHHG